MTILDSYFPPADDSAATNREPVFQNEKKDPSTDEAAAGGVFDANSRAGAGIASRRPGAVGAAQWESGPGSRGAPLPLKVRQPENIEEMIDCPDIMSSRTAA